MFAIMNNEATVAEYVTKEIATNQELKVKAFELYKLNLKEAPKSIVQVIQMLTDMYTDFCWTCGFPDDEIAMMDIELEQFVNESVEILQS